MKFNMRNSARDAPRWAFKPEEAVYGVWKGLFQDIRCFVGYGVCCFLQIMYVTGLLCSNVIVNTALCISKHASNDSQPQSQLS